MTWFTSLLSRQASTLEQAGYIAIRKGHVGKRPRTWLKLTPEGRTAFTDHLATLARSSRSPPPRQPDAGQHPGHAADRLVASRRSRRRSLSG